jgi:hypothetical protein
VEEPKQPRFSGALSREAKALGGGNATRSQRRLAVLGLDPMAAMVDQYRAIEAEIQYQEMLRDGRIKELNGKGEVKTFYPDNLYALYDKLAKISGDLLRYGYGRVPETNTVNTVQKAPMIIKLTKGGEKVLNAPKPKPDEPA